MKLRTLLQGAGVVALVLFPFYRILLDMPGDLRMHTPVSAAPLTLSLIANLIAVSLVFMLVGLWLRSTSRWAWLRLFLPALVLASLAEVIYIARGGWESTRLWGVVLLVVMFITLLLHWRWLRGEKLLLRLSGALLIGLGFFCILIVLQLLRLAMWRQLPNYTSEKPVPVTNRAPLPRIVWILFDELSYQQVFGDRFRDLELPNFDELRKSSTLFTDARPIINYTQTAIPSILLGQTIVRVNYTTRNQLEVGRATGPLFPFDAAQTPFALARQHGLSTGVVGWYNPYCGILAPYLNQCYWTFELQESMSSEQENFSQDLLLPWSTYDMVFRYPARIFSGSYRARIVEDLMLPATVKRMLDPNDRIRVYKDLMHRANQILGPSGPDFVFLHLPVPHPPGFYNRKTRQFDTSGKRSYIDNLALADKTLGQLLAILKQSPRWKNTSVIICGDHSWRVYMYPGAPFWTPEDESASHGGVFDPRPMLMVHLAGQTTPQTVGSPFPLIQVHTVLDDLVEGKQPSFVPAKP